MEFGGNYADRYLLCQMFPWLLPIENVEALSTLEEGADAGLGGFELLVLECFNPAAKVPETSALALAS